MRIVMNTILPPKSRQWSLKTTKRAVRRESLESPALATKPAHPLFPADQVFLWLPGLPGEQLAHCTYNEASGIPGTRDFRSTNHLPLVDKNQVSYSPPFPVSAETCTAWHTNVMPPFPFHPIPIARSLSAAEMECLGKRVHFLSNTTADDSTNPLQILRNSRKCYVLAALAEMGLLTGRIPQPC